LTFSRDKYLTAGKVIYGWTGPYFSIIRKWAIAGARPTFGVGKINLTSRKPVYLLECSPILAPISNSELDCLPKTCFRLKSALRYGENIQTIPSTTFSIHSASPTPFFSRPGRAEITFGIRITLGTSESYFGARIPTGQPSPRG